VIALKQRLGGQQRKTPRFLAGVQPPVGDAGERIQKPEIVRVGIAAATVKN